MKVTKEDTNISEDFKLTKAEMKKMRDYMLYGIPSKDSKGHSTFFSVRMQESQWDLITAIKDYLPGWWKTNASLQRSIIAVGTFYILCNAKNNVKTKKVEELQQVLEGLSFLSKHERKEALFNDIQKLKTQILNSDIPIKARLKVQTFMNDLEIKAKKATK